MRKPTDTKDKLMDTAIMLIWQSSYSNVGVAEICKQAGVTKGSFYHYFETKQDLFYEASTHHWDKMRHDLDNVFSPTIPPLKQLDNFLERVLTKQLEREHSDDNPVAGCPFFTSGSQATCEESKIRQASQEISEKMIQYYTAMIRALKEEGMLSSNVDPKKTARMVYQYVMGLLIYGRVQGSLDIVAEDLREAIYRIIDLKQEHRKKGNDAKLIASYKKEVKAA